MDLAKASVLLLVALVAGGCSASASVLTAEAAREACRAYSRGASQLMLDLAADSTSAESLVVAGADQDFDEDVSAELAAEFSGMAAQESRLEDLRRIGIPPEEWNAVRVTLTEIIALHRLAFSELARGFDSRDAALLGEAALKMARALEVQAELGERWPVCMP